MTDAWVYGFGDFDPADQGRREALCTLANGLFATRGAFAESSYDGVHYPGTYAAGCFNRLVSTVHDRTLEHESMVNLPNWLPLTFRPQGGEWLDLSAMEALDHRQVLDMRRGVLMRQLRVEDPSGRRTAVSERRLVSMADPNLAAIEWLITPENWSGAIEVRSSIDGTVENRNVPDEHELAGRHLRIVARDRLTPDTVSLTAETVQSRIRVAVAARTRVTVGGSSVMSGQVDWSPTDVVGTVIMVDSSAGVPVAVEKVASLYTGRDPAISEPGIAAAATLAAAGGFEDVLEDHVAAWDRLWRRCRLEVAGPDATASRTLNLHLFHTIQTLSPHVVDRDVGIPARGLHGEAYRGHLFWDEVFVFPVLDLRMPGLTRELLLYRYRRLGSARRLAADEGRRGAMYPWQSGSDGREETPTQFWNPRSQRWMPDNSRRQRHVALAVAYSVWRYVDVTGDTGFLADYGAEMLVEISRFFADLAELDPGDGRYHIRGVMGPDEFQDGYPSRPGQGVDDNAYTNVMVSWLLRRAAEACVVADHDGAHVGERLGVGVAELDLWDEVSRRLHVPFLDGGAIAQFAGSGQLDELDWDGYRQRYGNIGRLDLILEAEGDTFNRYQALKQADTLMLLYLFTPEELTEMFDHLGYPVDDETLRSTVDYYLARTTNGSSLSRIAHSWALSRIDPERSWNALLGALECDVADTQGGTVREGIHLGSMAGTVDVVQRCYTGIRVEGGMLTIEPRLPGALEAVRFPMEFRGHRLEVEVTGSGVRVESAPGDAPALTLDLGGEKVTLEPGKSVAAET